MITPATSFTKGINKMATGKALTPATTRQGVLDLGVEVERVVAGVEMGVLENGMSYLTQRGLAEMSGAARSTIQELTQEWQEAQQSGLSARKPLKRFLTRKGGGFCRPTPRPPPRMQSPVDSAFKARKFYPDGI
jgi:hypothetical protein